MKITESTVAKEGGCNYCDRGELSLGGSNLIYPYEKVIVVQGTSIQSRFCVECYREFQGFEVAKENKKSIIELQNDLINVIGCISFISTEGELDKNSKEKAIGLLKKTVGALDAYEQVK